MSSKNATNAPSLAQRIIDILGGNSAFAELGIVAMTIHKSVVHFLGGKPHFHRMTISEVTDRWFIELVDDNKKQLATVSSLTDARLLRWVRLLHEELPGWEKLMPGKLTIGHTSHGSCHKSEETESKTIQSVLK